MGSKKVWAILLIWFLSLICLFLIVSVRAEAETLQFQWNFDPEQNEDPVEIDGFRLYQRIKGGEYGEAVVDIDKTMRSVEIGLDGIAGQKIDYEFVLRAYKGDIESANSNQVDFSIDKRAPSAPTDLTVTITIQIKGDTAQ